MAVDRSPIAMFTKGLRPVTIVEVPNGGFGTQEITLTIQQARRLRDSLNIVLKEMEGSVFDFEEEK